MSLTKSRALTLIQHPFVDAKQRVEPHAVVKRSGHIGFEAWEWYQRGTEKVEIGNVGGYTSVSVGVIP